MPILPARSLLKTALAACLLFAGWPALAENRVALVIGNSNYAHTSPLPNAAQDARDVAQSLRKIGFDVHDGYDLTRVETLRLVAGVTAALDQDDVALFYFSGHGIQLGAENFVLPVDASGADGAELKKASVSLQSILREMELRADRNVVILDACRNNPFQSTLSGRSVGGVSRGLARVDAGVGSYIAFSTQPGNIALDGTGRNSPFTEALLRHLDGNATNDLHELMRKVRADVVEATDGTQIPWENSSLIEQLYLGQPSGRARQTALAPAPQPVAPVTPVQPQPQPQAQFTHMVSGLDPNGDGFLALRSGTTSGARRLAKMTEGTRLTYLGRDGAWFHVITETGLQGWAHSNWIRATGARSGATAAANQCEALWLRRNTFFHQKGYCFSSARGQAAFSNANCIPGLAASDIRLSQAEKDEIARIRALEASQGCN